MKRKTLERVAILVMVIIAALNINFVSKKEFSALSLANIEALAQNELPGVGITCGASEGTCWDNDGYEYTWTPFGGFRVTRCAFIGYIWASCFSGMPA